MKQILLVDDDLRVTQAVLELLTRENYYCQIARSMKQMHEVLSSTSFQLIILDRRLPDGDGVNSLEFLRKYYPTLPVLFFSELGHVRDRVIGLRAGADDYLPKPFDSEELLLRIENLLKKTKHLNTSYMKVGSLEFQPQKGIAQVRDQPFVQLRRRESEILHFLIEHKNSIVTRDQIIRHLWRDAKMPTYSTVDVYIRRLRMLLDKGKMIKTVRGYGYMIRDEQQLLI